MYTVRMNQKYSNGTMFQYYKDLDENLAWLTQKTEEFKKRDSGAGVFL